MRDIHIYVTDEDLTSLPSVFVGLYSADGSVRLDYDVTNEEGLVVFYGVSDGEYEIRIGLSGRPDLKLKGKKVHRISIHEDSTFDIVLEKAPPILPTGNAQLCRCYFFQHKNTPGSVSPTRIYPANHESFINTVLSGFANSELKEYSEEYLVFVADLLRETEYFVQFGGMNSKLYKIKVPNLATCPLDKLIFPYYEKMKYSIIVGGQKEPLEGSITLATGESIEVVAEVIRSDTQSFLLNSLGGFAPVNGINTSTGSDTFTITPNVVGEFVLVPVVDNELTHKYVMPQRSYKGDVLTIYAEDAT